MKLNTILLKYHYIKDIKVTWKIKYKAIIYKIIYLYIRERIRRASLEKRFSIIILIDYIKNKYNIKIFEGLSNIKGI